MAIFVSLLLSAVLVGSPTQSRVQLRPGMTLTKSAKLRPTTLRAPSAKEDPKAAALVIRGNNLVLDFGGATLEGSSQLIAPNERKGLGVWVEGTNVTIKNLKIRGYKVALWAKDVPGLKLIDCDFSYNWKQKLLSTVDREDLSDWMSYHHNEANEWLRYGAGAYLEGCNGFEVKGCKSVSGQCALMLTRSNNGLVWNNDFSFNSGLGLGMYRSSDNRIMHNKMDWCVRGYSYGKYNRGQDSSGILIFEQCHRNLFAYNSATHGGDGFFLWAGQQTMDTGKGGCNDNVLYGNDFSHSPANGIEATFSRNVFVNNLLLECWHGVWGGYSYETKIIGNQFGNNAEGIAIEHGQDNSILGNVFHRDDQGVVLWADPGAPDPTWGYPKQRDVRSRDTIVEGNRFRDIRSNALNVRNTVAFNVANNAFEAVGALYRKSADATPGSWVGNSAQGIGPGTQFPEGGSLNRVLDKGPYSRAPLPPASALNQGEDTDPKDYAARFKTNWNPYQLPELATEPTLKTLVAHYRPKPMVGGMNAMLPPGTPRGWRYMFVDEWGPYDFRRPILALRGPALDAGAGTHSMDGFSYQNFEVLGPKGKWRLISIDGTPAEKIQFCCGGPSPLSGVTPATIRIPLLHAQSQNVDIELEFVGDAVVDARGVAFPKGKPYRFAYRKHETAIAWDVRWFGWDLAKVKNPQAEMPRPSDLLEANASPLAKTHIDRLDFASGGSPFANVPNDHFITLADGAFEVKPGSYEIGVTSDDGVRVWLDEKLIIDAWKWQAPTRYEKVVKLGGKHKLRVEHYEIDGYTTLKVEVTPRR